MAMRARPEHPAAPMAGLTALARSRYGLNMPISFARRGAGLVCIALIVVSGVQCSSSTVKSSSTSTAPTSSVIGAAGGTVASSDATIDVKIPAGALSKDTTVTIEVAAATATGAIGNVYEIGPTGTTFTAPVTMTFHYASLDLGGHQPAELRVATEVAGAWQPLAGPAQDASARTVSGTTTHFSKYAIVSDGSAVPCTSDSMTKTCDAGTPNTGPCGPSTCIHGCCSGNMCIETAEQTKCGLAGQQCMDCSPGPCMPNPSDGRGGSCNAAGGK